MASVLGRVLTIGALVIGVMDRAGTPGVPGDWTAPYKEYLGAVLRNAEERYLVRMLRLHRGNINQIARLMEVDRKTVYRKMEEYGIAAEEFR